MPTGHNVAVKAHKGAPATLYAPAAQGAQDAGALAYVPAGHEAAVYAQVDALETL